MIQQRILLLIGILVFCSCSRAHIVSGMIPPIPTPEHSDRAVLKGFAIQTLQAQGVQSGALVSEGTSVNRITRVLDKILKANESKDKYQAFLVAKDESNAFTEGKAIYIYSKLFSQLRNDTDLAAIVSHELAHISCGHTSIDREALQKRRATVQVISAIIGGLAAAAQARSNPYASQQSLNNTANTYGKLGLVVGQASAVAPYERDQEREADEVGMMMAARAGYDPDKFYDFWVNADTILGTSSAGLLSSHPANNERANNLKSILDIAKEYYKCAMKSKKQSECKKLVDEHRCQQMYCQDFRIQ